MSENYWASNSINISQALYDKLDEIAQKRFGYTGEGIIDDLVEEIIQDYVNSPSIIDSKAIFQVETHFDEFFPYVVISSTKKEYQDSDFLGKMDVGSKDAIIRIARDGWGISEDRIQFIN